MSDIEPTTTPATPTQEPTPLQILIRMWGHKWPNNRDCDPEYMFVIEESMVGCVVAAFKGHEDFRGVKVTRAQANAVLEYWRTRNIQAVEEVATRLRAEIASHRSESTEGKSMSDIDPTEQLAAWKIFDQQWRNMHPYSKNGLENAFIIDELPGSLVDKPELKLTQSQAHAALEYWRAHMIKAVEEMAARYHTEIASRLAEPESPSPSTTSTPPL